MEVLTIDQIRTISLSFKSENKIEDLKLNNDFTDEYDFNFDDEEDFEWKNPTTTHEKLSAFHSTWNVKRTY